MEINMEETEKVQIDEARRAVKKMIDLNELFLDSVKFNSCECADKYSYVSMEFGKLTWVMAEYLGIFENTDE